LTLLRVLKEFWLRETTVFPILNPSQSPNSFQGPKFRIEKKYHCVRVVFPILNPSQRPYFFPQLDVCQCAVAAVGVPTCWLTLG
jgi:hypothetical protein